MGDGDLDGTGGWMGCGAGVVTVGMNSTSGEGVSKGMKGEMRFVRWGCGGDLRCCGEVWEEDVGLIGVSAVVEGCEVRVDAGFVLCLGCCSGCGWWSSFSSKRERSMEGR